MIKEIIIKPQNKYGKYFLSMEAPGDDEQEQDVEEQPVVKSNTKVIDVKPNNRKKLDFTDGADEPDEEDDTDMSEEQPVDDYTADTTDNTDIDTGDDTYYTDDSGNQEDIQQTDTGTTDDAGTEPQAQEDPNQPTVDGDGVDTTDNADIDTGDDTDYTDDGSTGDEGDDGVDDSTGDTGELDTGDGEDFTDGAGDDTGDGTADTGDTGDTSSDQTGGSKGPGLEYDSTRKYILFENFISLSNAIDNYISKLENNITDNMNSNKIIKNAVNKLREIEELCSTYMTMKFEASGYVQSLLFFQNLVVMIQLVFDYVDKSYKSLKNNNN